MSLNKLLAVGRSFAGSPREKSPFEMRKDVRLPTFENAPRFAVKSAEPVQADWLTETAHQPAPYLSAEPRSQSDSPKPKSGSRPRRRWLSILTFGLLGRRQQTGELVQAEMNLDKVRVIRNDLLDADLEVVVNKKKERFALRALESATPKPAEPETPIVSETPRNRVAEKKRRSEWTELTARLFEIGQQ